MHVKDWDEIKERCEKKVCPQGKNKIDNRCQYCKWYVKWE